MTKVSAFPFLVVCLVAAPADARLKVGDVAPHYRIRTLDDREVDSDTLKGQVVIVNRWASWCAPCKAELPALDAYYRAHARDGLHIFAVTTDAGARAQTLKTYSATLTFPIARSVRGGLPQLAGVPTNYVIDRRGVIRYAEADVFDEAKLEEVVGPLLREPVSTPSTR